MKEFPTGKQRINSVISRLSTNLPICYDFHVLILKRSKNNKKYWKHNFLLISQPNSDRQVLQEIFRIRWLRSPTFKFPWLKTSILKFTLLYFGSVPNHCQCTEPIMLWISELPSKHLRDASIQKCFEMHPFEISAALLVKHMCWSCFYKLLTGFHDWSFSGYFPYFAE